MKLIRPVVFSAALILAVLLSYTAGTSAGTNGKQPVWLPLHIAARGEQYQALAATSTVGITPPLQYIYAKQSNQITFKLCAQFMGDGEVLLAYGGAGDGIEFHDTQWEWRCILTETGWGGGNTGIPLDVYLFQRGKAPAQMSHPSLFVSSE